MRNFIDIVSKPLLESIDFHPSVKTVRDGETYVDYPPNSSHRVEKRCRGCLGTGKDDIGEKCYYCNGTGRESETVYTIPNINVANGNAYKILSMLGLKTDYAGYIEPEVLRPIRRRLTKIKSDPTYYTREPTDSHRPTNGTVDYDNPPFGIKVPMLFDYNAMFILEDMMKAASVGDWSMVKAVYNRTRDISRTPNANEERWRSKLEGYYTDLMVAGGNEAAQATFGPRMINRGVDIEQVLRYVDKMIEIIDWAIANDTGVSWSRFGT